MSLKSRVRESITVLGILWMFGLSVAAYLIWYIAFINGGTVTVNIDAFGEGPLELVVLHIATGVITLALYWTLKKRRRTSD